MIENGSQYSITLEARASFERSLVAFDSEDHTGMHPLLVKALRESQESEIAALTQQIIDYEVRTLGRFLRAGVS